MLSGFRCTYLFSSIKSWQRRHHDGAQIQTWEIADGMFTFNSLLWLYEDATRTFPRNPQATTFPPYNTAVSQSTSCPSNYQTITRSLFNMADAILSTLVTPEILSGTGHELQHDEDEQTTSRAGSIAT
jgi:hypothetical protein